MRAAAAALVLVTLLVAGCHADGRTVMVPDLYGRDMRSVQTTLAGLGLKWRYFGSERVWSGRPDPNLRTTTDDDLVVEQYPPAGTTVRRGWVVQLMTSCTLEPLPAGAVCID